MESRAAQPAQENPVTPVAFSGQNQTPRNDMPLQDPKAIGYGLPCSNCRAYYPADMPVCPICKSAERVLPTAVAAAPATPVAAAPEPETPVDDGREHFLKELKSQAFASHTQTNSSARFPCTLEHRPHGNSARAAFCQTCYNQVKELADRMEAALHMDAKEAARIVYEAVWADTSDPNKTHQTAAAALLLELRKRAGLGLLLGSHRPRAH